MRINTIIGNKLKEIFLMYDISKILNRYVESSELEIEAFAKILKPIVFEKNEHFLLEGQNVTSVCYVTDGLFEMYKINEEGNEISIDFFFNDSFVTDYVSYLTLSKCQSNVRAIQKSSVLVFEKEDMDKLFESSIQFQKLGRVLAEQEFIVFANRLREGSLTPKERYYKLVQDKPHWIQNIPHYKLASFLNISPEWLSKIRKGK